MWAYRWARRRRGGARARDWREVPRAELGASRFARACVASANQVALQATGKRSAGQPKRGRAKETQETRVETGERSFKLRRLFPFRA